MEKELISREERADGAEVRYYIDEEGRETMEVIPAKEDICGAG